MLQPPPENTAPQNQSKKSTSHSNVSTNLCEVSSDETHMAASDVRPSQVSRPPPENEAPRNQLENSTNQPNGSTNQREVSTDETKMSAIEREITLHQGDVTQHPKASKALNPQSDISDCEQSVPTGLEPAENAGNSCAPSFHRQSLILEVQRLLNQSCIYMYT